MSCINHRTGYLNDARDTGRDESRPYVPLVNSSSLANSASASIGFAR